MYVKMKPVKRFIKDTFILDPIYICVNANVYRVYTLGVTADAPCVNYDIHTQTHTDIGSL